jgi:tRNA(Ile)-lysidine synthase TilS/MesJ
MVKNPCPADGNTKREYIKQLIKTLEKENPGVRTRMFHAVTEFWKQRTKTEHNT